MSTSRRPGAHTRSRPSRQASREAPRRAESAGPAGPAERAVLAGIGAFLALRLAASLLAEGPARSWGIDVARYLLPGADAWIALLLPLLALLPPLRRALERAAEAPPAPGPRRLYWPFALTATALACLLSVRYQVAFAFLGDGSYYVGELYRTIATPDYHPAFLKTTSLATGHALRALALALRPENARLPFTVLGTASLAVLCLALAALLRREARPVALAAGALFLLGAGTLMSFGYIELYALSTVFAAVYCLAGWRALARGASLAAPAAALLAAVLFAPSALFLAPSFLLLAHAKVRGEGGPVTLRAAAAILAAAPFAAALCGYLWYGASDHTAPLLPLLAGDPARGPVQRSTLLSPARWADLANLLLLHGGAALAVVLALLAARRKDPIWTRPPVLFALVALAGGLAFAVFGNTFLGLARDWDVTAAAMLPLPLLAVALLAGLHDEGRLRVAAVAPALILTVATSFFLWFRVNVPLTAADGAAGDAAAGDAAARRFDDILRMDREQLLPIHTYTGLENLRKYHHAARDDARTLDILERMAATRHHVADTYGKHLATASACRDAARRRAAWSWLFAALRADLAAHPADAGLRALATRALLASIQAGDADLAAAEIARVDALLGRWRERAFVEGFLLPGLPAEERARRAAEAVDTASADAALLIAAARLQAAASRAPLAARYYERALACDPAAYPDAYIELAALYERQLGDRERCLDALRRCVAHSRGTAASAEAATILSNIGPP